MNNEPLEIKVSIQVSKPAAEVFEAIVDPVKLSNYFLASGSGRMEKGAALTWYWPEFKEGSQVLVGKIEKDQFISFTWGAEEGTTHPVEISLYPIGTTATKITIIEKGGDHDEAGIKWLKSNTEGWANFLACLKAYLEYGINLRKGAFDFIKA